MTAKLARAGWLVCLLILFPAAVVGLAVILRDPDLVSSQAFLEVIDRVGISPVVAAWIGFVIPTAGAFIVALVIRRGRPSDPPALLFGLSVIALFLLVAGVGTALSTVISNVAARAVDVLVAVLVLLGLYLFPNGRFVPGWSRWPALVLIATTLTFPNLLRTARAMGTDTASTASEELRGLANAATLLLLATWLPAQIQRYRRWSTPLERLQTRWVIFGFALIVAGSTLAILLRSIGTPSEWVAWPLLLGAAGSLILPIAAGLAILRYRLYEIDRIISRAITYTLLVGLLAGLYTGAVFAITLLVPASGDVAVAGSTLAVAAVFNPLRRRIQEAVDRRFNRPRYDATLLIESFTVRLRARAELTEVLADLRRVLVDTVEPSSSMIWLRGFNSFQHHDDEIRR